jgi:hypothetical protein
MPAGARWYALSWRLVAAAMCAVALFCVFAHPAWADDPPPPALTFSSNSDTVEEPSPAVLTASWSGGDQPSPYSVRIVGDDDYVFTYCSVYGNDHCTTSVGGWWQLPVV